MDNDEITDQRIIHIGNIVVEALGILPFEWTRVVKKDINQKILNDFLDIDPRIIFLNYL